MMIWLSFILCFFVARPSMNTQLLMKSYSVRKVAGDVALTGKGDDAAWKTAQSLTDFSYPWEDDINGATTFRALHNSEWLYCLFEVQDDHIVLATDKEDKAAVAASSRAEIFFRIDDKLAPYYAVELDPAGRVLDYQAAFYRKFNSDWSWPQGHMKVKTFRSESGYSVELAISMASLRQLGLLKDHRLEAGLFRADCLHAGNNINDFKWVSWVKPESTAPDFHIPSSFGIFLLEN